MWFSKKGGKSDSKTSKALKELNSLRGKKLHHESIEELNTAIRNFLKEKYNFQLGLTTQEILLKINAKKIDKKIKLDLAHLLLKIYGKEYRSEDPLNKKEFNNLLNETKQVVMKIGSTTS